MKIKRESGRTMVEMLGVLAIVVVLSGLGIWSVNFALNYYKAYRISSAAQERTILVKQNTRIRKNKDTGYSNLLNGDVMGVYPIEYVPTYSVAAYDVNELKAFQVSAFNQGVCQHLKNMGTLQQIKDYTGLPVLINNTDIDDEPECIPGDETANKLIVLFDEGRGRSINNPCAGVECACGSCVDGTCSDTEKTITLCDGTKKVCCAGDPNCKDEENCCPADRIYIDNGVTKCCDNVLSNGHCCATGESWASADNKCCVTGNISNNHCCLGGQVWASGDNKCCTSDKLYNDNTKCCDNVLSNGHCCATGESWASADNKCCVTGNISNNHCCPGGQVWASGDNKCCTSDKLYNDNTKCCSGTIRTLSNGTRVCQGPDQCWYNNQVYNNNAVVGTCGKCVNGIISTDTSKVGTCQICNESTWALGNVTNGTAVGECKQCSNGQVVAKSGYTVPTCKVCNADGSLSNATNGSNQQTNGQCCVNGEMALSQTYCPICTFKNKIYLNDTDVPSSGKTCGWCQNGTIIEDHSYDVTACEYCNHNTWLWTTITPTQLTTTTTRSSVRLYNASHTYGYFNVYRKKGTWTNNTNINVPISLGEVKITKYVYGLRKIDGTTTIGSYKYRTWEATQAGMLTLSDSSIKVNGVAQDLGTMVNGMLSLEKSGGSDLTQDYRERLVNLDGTTHNYATDSTKRVWTQTHYYDFQGATYNVQPGKTIEIDIWTVCTDDSCQNFFCQP